jgi:hypothetical protein
MAEKIVSPGVFTRENDLSFLPQGISQIGAAVVGPTEKGPAFVPTLVTSQAEYEQIFGAPKDYYTGYTVQNYLRDAGSVTVVRVTGTDGHTTLAGGSGGTYVVYGTDDSGETKKVIAVLESSTPSDDGSLTSSAQFVGTEDVQPDPLPLTKQLVLTLGSTPYTVSIDLTQPNSIDKVLGTTPSTKKTKYASILFDETDIIDATYEGCEAGSLSVGQLPSQNFRVMDNGYANAETPWIVSQIFNGTSRYDLFKVKTISHGESENQRFKIQISNVKILNDNYGTFTLTVRDFNDTDKRKVVLETYSNLTLDPTSPNYIARRIGDRYTTIESTGKIKEFGDYSNKSKFIYIEVKEEGSFPTTASPFGFGAYELPVYLTGAVVGTDFPVVKYSTESSASNGANSSGFEFGDTDTIAAKNNKNYLNPIPASAGTGSNEVFGLDDQVGLVAEEVSGSNATVKISQRNFCVALQGGYSGTNPTIIPKKGADIVPKNTQGINCNGSAAWGTKAYVKALNTLSNADEIDINLLVTPGIIRKEHNYVSQKAIDMCEEREDVFYIADFVGANDDITSVVEEAGQVDSNYAGTYYPWVKTVDALTNRILPVPPSVLLVGTYAQNDRLGAEWFAPAGLNRGGIQGAVQVMNRLTQSERDTLYEGKVNPIAAFPGQGISAFGQKTLQESASALDRINVRRLLINLKKFVASTSRFLVFEQNTGQTRAKFLNTVNPYLESVQQRQGLYAFRVVMDETNNTPDVIDRNILQGSVFLQPAKTAEFIVIDFNILPTGATFSV